MAASVSPPWDYPFVVPCKLGSGYRADALAWALALAALVIGAVLLQPGCAAPLQQHRPALSHRLPSAMASSVSPLAATLADDSLWYLTPQLPTFMNGFHSAPQDRGPLRQMYPADAWREVENPNCERAKRSSDLVRAFAFCNTPR